MEGETSLGQTDTVCKREPAGYHGNGRGGEGGGRIKEETKKKSKMKSRGSRKVQDEKWHEEARNESGSEADRR